MKRLLSLMLVLSGCLGLGTSVSVVAAEAAMAKPDAAKGEALYSNGDAARGIAACSSCHGAAGNSGGAENPKLAGQHPDYIVRQLHAFQSIDGKKPARANVVMNSMAAALTADDVRNIAAYLGAQKLKPATAKKPDLTELGQKIFRGGIASKGVAACAACHGPTGSGIPGQFPHIAGQFAEYTVLQLQHFRSGERSNNASMQQVATNLSDTEIQAVADYIAGLR